MWKARFAQLRDFSCAWKIDSARKQVPKPRVASLLNKYDRLKTNLNCMNVKEKNQNAYITIHVIVLSSFSSPLDPHAAISSYFVEV